MNTSHEVELELPIYWSLLNFNLKKFDILGNKVFSKKNFKYNKIFKLNTK